MKSWLLWLTLLSSTGALAQAGGSESATNIPTIEPLPASFVGELPCADCAAIHYQIDLFEDQVFYLRMTYAGKDQQFDDIGRWTLSPDGTRLTLNGGRDAPAQWAIQDQATLRKLDLEGRMIESRLNYDLRRTDSFQPVEPGLAMTGMYQYMADAGRFTECRTGRAMAVAQEQDNAALEAAYTHARTAPNEEILVSLEGRIALRPNMEGSAQQSTLVVERFIELWPHQQCPSSQSVAARIEDTEWQLIQLGATVLPVRNEGREPAHSMLQSKDQLLAGSGGCNRISGGYKLNGPVYTTASSALIVGWRKYTFQSKTWGEILT